MSTNEMNALKAEFKNRGVQAVTYHYSVYVNGERKSPVFANLNLTIDWINKHNKQLDKEFEIKKEKFFI